MMAVPSKEVVWAEKEPLNLQSQMRAQASI
jgi:hypothetical protein